MHYLFLSMFLTLVVYSHGLWANSRQDLKPYDTEKSQEKLYLDTTSLSVEGNNLILTQPHMFQLTDILAQELHHPFRQSLSLRLGTIVDIDRFESEFKKSMRAVFGFQYLFPIGSISYLEAGADIVKNQGGQLHISQRWTLDKHTSFRPFYKLGALLQITGKEGLATFANHKNYFAKASIGFEDTFKGATSVRFDLELAVNAELYWLFLTFGYSWGF